IWLAEEGRVLEGIAQVIVRRGVLLAAPLADKVREVFPLRSTGEPNMRPQRVDEHTDFRVDLLGEDALQDEAKARPQLPGNNGEVAQLLFGNASEPLHAVAAQMLRRRGVQQEGRLAQPLHTRVGRLSRAVLLW